MMPKTFKKILPILLLLILIPGAAFAHQPRMVESRRTIVADPEVSKAYYGQLEGAPDTFVIEANAPFDLYTNVLVPDIAWQKKDVSATIAKDGKIIATLDGTNFAWKKMFEPFGHDTYWTGPEYKTKAEPGSYSITVTSSKNDSKYSLAIGETESFNFKEVMNALTVIPKLKTAFFNESPIGFILSPFGWGLILALYVLAAFAGLAYRLALKRLAKTSTRRISKNIGARDRIIRLAIGLALLLLAITTSWNLILIFISGFAIFEAVFSWCGFYAALGKNSCPINPPSRQP